VCRLDGRRRGARRARRVQNMGWTSNNSLWLGTRGGDVFFSPQPGVSEKFDQAKLGSRGFGILDVACAPGAAGGRAVPARRAGPHACAACGSSDQGDLLPMREPKMRPSTSCLYDQ